MRENKYNKMNSTVNKEKYTAPLVEVLEVDFSLPIMALSIPGEPA